MASWTGAGGEVIIEQGKEGSWVSEGEWGGEAVFKSGAGSGECRGALGVDLPRLLSPIL